MDLDHFILAGLEHDPFLKSIVAKDDVKCSPDQLKRLFRDSRIRHKADKAIGKSVGLVKEFADEGDEESELGAVLPMWGEKRGDLWWLQDTQIL